MAAKRRKRRKKDGFFGHKKHSTGFGEWPDKFPHPCVSLPRAHRRLEAFPRRTEFVFFAAINGLKFLRDLRLFAAIKKCSRFTEGSFTCVCDFAALFPWLFPGLRREQEARIRARHILKQALTTDCTDETDKNPRCQSLHP